MVHNSLTIRIQLTIPGIHTNTVTQSYLLALQEYALLLYGGWQVTCCLPCYKDPH
jgi:hypothetical protein